MLWAVAISLFFSFRITQNITKEYFEHNDEVKENGVFTTKISDLLYISIGMSRLGLAGRRPWDPLLDCGPSRAEIQ